MPHRLSIALLLCCVLLPGQPARSTFNRRPDLPTLKGKVLDLTNNHGRDNRLWSTALNQRRDLYIYLPPCYDPNKRYPVLLWLHQLAEDEQAFLGDPLTTLDKAIADGILPPMIIAAPDGSISGAPRLLRNGSFFINTPRAGNFEDFLIGDVWAYLHAHFPLRPEARAHVLAGASMGGFAAFNKVLKYPDTFGIALGIYPPLHARYADCRGRALANFDPACQGIRTDLSNPRTLIGRFFHFLKVRQPDILEPLDDPRDPDTVARVSAENPYELLNPCKHAGGKVALYAGYGEKDEFNIDAHVEAFAYKAKGLNIPLTTERLAGGQHLPGTARKLMPGAIRWLGQQLAGLP